MIVLISTTALIGLTLWFQASARIRPELAPLSACTSVVVVVYAAALAGVLAPATVALYACGLALGLVGLRKLFAQPEVDRAAIIVSLTVFTGASVASWVWLNGLAYSSWDEFSHWGRVSRAISRLAVLPGHSTEVILKDYPPGAALFHYFILSSRFSEGGSYFAQALILVACALALIRWHGLAKATSYILVLALGLLLFAILGLGYATVEVDHLLGGLFGAAAAAVAIGGPEIRPRIVLIPVVFCMPLIKPIGLIPALCVAAIVVFDVLRLWYLSRFRGQIGSYSRSHLIVACLVVMAPLVAHQSWNQRVRALAFDKTFDVKFDTEGLRTLATSSRRSATQERVVDSFGRAFRSAPVGRNGNGVIAESGVWRGLADRLPPSTALHWLSVLGALSLVAYFLQTPSARPQHVIVHSMLLLGCAGYLVILLYVYVFGFREYEASRVISFGRYVSTWFLAWALAVVASLGNSVRGTWTQQVAAMLILLCSSAWALARAPHEDPLAVMTARARVAIQAVMARVDGLLDPGARVYIVWQQTNGFQFHLTAYELSPRMTNTWCWTLGEKYHPQDAWTCPLSVEEFARQINEYDYLLIMRGDQQFWQTYQSLFTLSNPKDEEANLLFEVTREGAAPKLRRVAVP